MYGVPSLVTTLLISFLRSVRLVVQVIKTGGDMSTIKDPPTFSWNGVVSEPLFYDVFASSPVLPVLMLLVASEAKVMSNCLGCGLGYMSWVRSVFSFRRSDVHIFLRRRFTPRPFLCIIGSPSPFFLLYSLGTASCVKLWIILASCCRAVVHIPATNV